MTRNLPGPETQESAGSYWRRQAHLALDRLLDQAHLQRDTGVLQVMVDVNEGGPRAVRTATDLKFRPPS